MRCDPRHVWSLRRCTVSHSKRLTGSRRYAMHARIGGFSCRMKALEPEALEVRLHLTSFVAVQITAS